MEENTQFDVVNGIRMMNYFCQGCNEVYAIPARRGRPPILCPKCSGQGVNTGYDARKAEELRIKAELRVDRLEMMLRANGSHISQHRHKWD